MSAPPSPCSDSKPQLLLVEDSKLFGSQLKSRIEEQLDFEVTWVQTYTQAEKILQDPTHQHLLALVDLNLPDAPMGEIVDLTTLHGLPAIVFAAGFGKEMRETIWSYKVIDYVIKESSHNIDYIVSLIDRIRRNRHTRVMVVDDSPSSRRFLGDLLRLHQYIVLEAADGLEALSFLDLFSDIKLVITDYNMPKMDGFNLTQRIRDRFSREDLAIIGMSSQTDNTLSARFIKNGANDFINKPFVTEEFYCRINQNMELLEKIEKIRDASNRDYLTGLYNRRYFFHRCQEFFAETGQPPQSVNVGMIDIDHFKRINDTFGHAAGDVVLKQVAQILNRHFCSEAIVARFGGEEFCVLLGHSEQKSIVQSFEQIRKDVENTEFCFNGEKIRASVSIGVALESREPLDETIKTADAMLYRAKNAGRNWVISNQGGNG